MAMGNLHQVEEMERFHGLVRAFQESDPALVAGKAAAPGLAGKDESHALLKVCQGQKGLPIVGETVRSKKYGTLWRVLEKREVWQTLADDPVTKEPRMVPAIYLAYWRVRDDVPPGVGKILGYLYTLYDNTFEANWVIVS